MAQKDWHIDGKGRFVHPKRNKGKFATKKARPVKVAKPAKAGKAC